MPDRASRAPVRCIHTRVRLTCPSSYARLARVVLVCVLASRLALPARLSPRHDLQRGLAIFRIRTTT
jgi:hypothetical protein